MNRLYTLYQDTIIKELTKEFGYTNKMAVPKITKVIVNMGIGDVARDKTQRDKVQKYLTQMTGQVPMFCPAKRSIAEFSIRQGDPIGIRSTLRGDRMYDFLDKLIHVVLPRVRDFQGISRTGFDGHGNYNLGLKEQIIFPEVNYDTIDRVRGLQVTICTTAKTNKETFQLLSHFGMPFEKEEQ
jgi:large subunit ribosomal protein L5